MATDRTDTLATAEHRATRRLLQLLAPAPVFQAHSPNDCGRNEVESYIATHFHKAHGAIISDFMPVLLTMGCNGNITAATGVRAAATQPLFLEQYLDEPVERIVTRITDSTVTRSEIAEIGNLVATQGGASYLLFMVLTAVLDEAGFGWVTFTATPQVQKVLGRLGLPVQRLCAADASRLGPESAKEWGRYYASRPQVVVGNVSGARVLLEQHALYAGALNLFDETITRLATAVRQGSHRHGTRRLAA